ncbi:MAG: hypothetical protein GEU98_06935 [Pseudonocardiaceae bacterium]|nr:hypothetical protein [Pseudonocardiaceae bacterium]
MLYLLAAVGAITVAVLLWRAFGPQRLGVASRGPGGSISAPDDDPDFLRKLDEHNKDRPDEDGKNER